MCIRAWQSKSITGLVLVAVNRDFGEYAEPAKFVCRRKRFINISKKYLGGGGKRLREQNEFLSVFHVLFWLHGLKRIYQEASHKIWNKWKLKCRCIRFLHTPHSAWTASIYCKRVRSPLEAMLYSRMWITTVRAAVSLARQILLRTIFQWSYGVTVSILDSESSDRGSNPRRIFEPFVSIAVRWSGSNSSFIGFCGSWRGFCFAQLSIAVRPHHKI